MKSSTLLSPILCLLLASPVSAAIAETPVAEADTALQISDVVVTGSNQATSRHRLPYTVSVVGRGDLHADYQPRLLSSLNGQVPSLFVTERSVLGFGVSTGGSGGIKIRGVGGAPTSEVLMLVDGQPQFAGLFSHHVADYYQNAYVDHVEVLRGPASVLYGSNAMGGVINVITREPKENGVHTRLSSQYGFYNTWLNQLSHEGRFGRFSYLVNAGYDRSDGNQKGLDFQQGSLYVKAAYEIGRHWKATADYSVEKSLSNDPVYPRVYKNQPDQVYRQDIVRGAASLTASHHYDRTNGSLRLYYSYGNHFVEDPSPFHSLDDRLGVMLYENFQTWKGATATVGFDFNTYSGEIPLSGGKAHTEGSLSTLERKSITEYSPYISLVQDFFGERLSLNAGLRMANSDRFGTHWIPQGGLTFRPWDTWSFKASVGKGYRNPSFKELYLYKMANPDLKPEETLNYEVGVGKHFGPWLDVALNAYWIEGRSIITVENMKNVNTGRFTNKGLELTLGSRPVSTLRLNASYSFLHTSMEKLEGAPRHQAYLGAAWQILPCLSVEADLRVVGRLYVADEVPVQTYALLNARAAYRPLKWLEVFLQLNNLTDTRYVVVKGYDMPGFHLTGGVAFSF